MPTTKQELVLQDSKTFASADAIQIHIPRNRRPSDTHLISVLDNGDVGELLRGVRSIKIDIARGAGVNRFEATFVLVDGTIVEWGEMPNAESQEAG